MATIHKTNYRTAMISLALLVLLLTLSAAAQDARPGQSSPVIQDWTTHHVVFSDPGTATEAIRAGRYGRWLEIVTDPRYIAQQHRRGGQTGNASTGISEPVLPAHTEVEPDIGAAAATVEMTLEQRDALRGGSRKVPSGLMRALIPPTGGMGEPLMSLGPASASINGMKKDWGEDLGSNGTVGLGDFPATYSTGGTNCNDFAVFNTGLTASSSQASIVAYRNLYTNCTGGPTVYWAYNTGGTITNAVVLSVDGTQVGFVQNNSSGVATLVLLKWAASGGSVTAPTTPTSVSASSYRGCTAPCMTTPITLSGSPTDTYSFPFYDYGTAGADDTIYVGDDGGALHKFTGVFLGTPAEAGSPWPVTVFPTTAGESALGSPVYDVVSGKVFVGDYLLNSSSNCEPSANTTAGTCGYLYSVSASGSTVTKSHELDYNVGLLDSPIVDPSYEEVYAFVGDDGTFNCTGSVPCAAVFQFPVSFASGATGTEAKVGPGYEFMMSGTFDNAYFTSGTGHMYVVGNTGPANNTLYQIPITSGTMGTSVTTGPSVSTNYTNSYYAAGLQVTEFYNTSSGNHDYIFLSVLAYGAPTTSYCGAASLTNGCVLGFDVTSGTITTGSIPTGAAGEAGGTSGIVVDNGASGASNIYFSTLLNQSCTGGTGGCAIQTSQSAP